MADPAALLRKKNSDKFAKDVKEARFRKYQIECSELNQKKAFLSTFRHALPNKNKHIIIEEIKKKEKVL